MGPPDGFQHSPRPNDAALVGIAFGMISGQFMQRPVLSSWNDLCEAVAGEAARCAAVNPSDAEIYVADRNRFVSLPAPTDAAGLAERKAEANRLRRQWFDPRPGVR